MSTHSLARHLHLALLAAVIVLTMVLFHRGIPWWAWLGAFGFMWAAAELLGTALPGAPGRDEAPEGHDED
ncbi:hypothetical protein, partial [Actinomyces sp. 217892]